MLDRIGGRKFKLVFHLYFPPKLHCRFDYSEVVESASSISTPPVTDEPFASDTLGDTIIKMEKVE